MRKSQKKQIENMIELLDKAQEAIRKALETKNGEIALSLLEQCQDSAIQIGGMIEESFGAEFVTVRFLEDYCEQIYQAYESIRQKQPVNANKIVKNLRKELIRIENSVRNDIQVRTTAVFLPYKASMWDSLESVWKAADEDPNCDAYVVPIPYFDKNPDGSFREMHYEGNEYPNYVPITSWETYDIAAQHPDMIFIHNPYDEFNHVTSVHPAYYAKELKNQADLLVYIPYFILGQANPDDKEEVEKLEHFCMVPAVIYADKVIVQSKKWKKFYIDVMTRTMGNDTRQVWEKKILDLGSPKMDKVFATGRDTVEIPEEWRRIIEKPDGNRKKIVFYNTSVSALLQHSEKMLEKLEYVFRIFRENQDEVALLWRPHPLIRATIESMRPQLWMAYEKMVKAYINEGWGIYDDTADINRAIALSDAYYGDLSSVVQMYEETGKPIMIQDVEVSFPCSPEKENDVTKNIISGKKINLRFQGYARLKNKIFFSTTYFNGLFELDLQNFSVKHILTFKGVDAESRHLHEGKVVVYNHHLFFFPTSCDIIHVYDVNTGQQEIIQVPLALGTEKYFHIVCVAIRGEKVWMFSNELSKGVFNFDLKNRKLDRNNKLTEMLSKYNAITNFVEIPEENKLYTCSVEHSILVEIDLGKEQVTEYEIEIANICIISLSYHEGRFWFVDKNSGDIYEWELHNCYTHRYRIGDLEWIEEKSIPFFQICFVKEKIYLLPCWSKYILELDKKTERIIKLAEYPEDFSFAPRLVNAAAFGNYEVIEDKIWLYPSRGNRLLVYDSRLNRFEGIEVSINFHEVFMPEGTVYETEKISVDILCNSSFGKEKYNLPKHVFIGEKIYHVLNLC